MYREHALHNFYMVKSASRRARERRANNFLSFLPASRTGLPIKNLPVGRLPLMSKEFSLDQYYLVKEGGIPNFMPTWIKNTKNAVNSVKASASNKIGDAAVDFSKRYNVGGAGGVTPINLQAQYKANADLIKEIPSYNPVQAQKINQLNRMELRTALKADPAIKRDFTNKLMGAAKTKLMNAQVQAMASPKYEMFRQAGKQALDAFV